MPQRAKGIRLWLRPTGHVVGNAVRLILDGGEHIATGCIANQIAEAKAKLAAYIAAKHQPRRTEKT